MFHVTPVWLEGRFGAALNTRVHRPNPDGEEEEVTAIPIVDRRNKEGWAITPDQNRNCPRQSLRRGCALLATHPSDYQLQLLPRPPRDIILTCDTLFYFSDMDYNWKLHTSGEFYDSVWGRVIGFTGRSVQVVLHFYWTTGSRLRYSCSRRLG